jgi:hypothetical protein
MQYEKTYRIEIAGTTHLTFEVGQLSNYGHVLKINNYSDNFWDDSVFTNDLQKKAIEVWTRKRDSSIEKICFSSDNPYLIVFKKCEPEYKPTETKTP